MAHDTNNTPTSVVFPSPVFETPRNSSFPGFSAGTPRFADEYSVFNTTPGNLAASQGPFADISVPSPCQSSTGHKRSLFAGDIAAQIATHVNHFSPSPNLPLPPVDPSRRLPSSPGPLAAAFSQEERTPSFGSQDRSIKKVRQSLEEAEAQQTLTPPPTSHKGGRKLAPKLQMNTMQNEDYPPGFVLSTPQQAGMPNFVTTPTDMFGYPLSAPATAPVFLDTHNFWDNDTSMNGMEYDFSAASAAMFQAQGHRPMSSLDWGRTNEMFQETGLMPQLPIQTQESNMSMRRDRPLAPKPTPSAPPVLESNHQDTSMFGTSYVAPLDNTFGIMNQGGGVDPGLLFSRPPSSKAEPVTFTQATQPPSVVQPGPVLIAPKPSRPSEIRRGSSVKETGAGKRLDRTAASSPIKSIGRPGLSRSFSDNKGRRAVPRALPALAPAARPVVQQTSSKRPVSQGSRNGRTSPLKNHHRLPSLGSIPEAVTPKMKTSVKFTIDSHGRARAETTTVTLSDDEDPTPRPIRGRKEARPASRGWSSSADDESSEDDDEIVIPSRNHSFALPDPNKPTSSISLQSLRRSFSEQTSSSLGIYDNEPPLSGGDADSEAETEVQAPQGSRGDATSELRKVVQDRQKRALSSSGRHLPRPRSSASTISPSSVSEASIPTPSSRGGSIRCVCRRIEGPRHGDGFMIQW
ncbi:hypothetical protein TruAng_002437 [Truncatella angustata]|nr:hypothetical protein TruAng_002437 [Truncatella angustata]